MAVRADSRVALLNLVLLLLSLAALAYFGSETIRHVTSLASHFQLPEFVVGFLVLGIGTALPDLFVSSLAAMRGNFNLVLGSIIGTNIASICLVLGIVTLTREKLAIKNKTILEDFGWIFFALVIPFFFLVDHTLSQMEGLVLVVVYFMFVYNIESEKGRFPKKYSESGGSLTKEVPFALVSTAGVLFFANLVVENAVQVSIDFGVPEIYIGFTLVAFGMALPEFSTALPAARANKEGLVWGDLIGSFVTNLTLVLGVAGLFGPLTFDFQLFQLGYAFMAISFLMVFFFTRSDNAIDEGEAMALILLYIVFLMIGYQLFSLFAP